MRITFVIPAFNISGGVRVASIHGGFLAEAGHEVTFIAPKPKRLNLIKLLRNPKKESYRVFKKPDLSYFKNTKCKLKLIESSVNIKEDMFPDADIIIATWWETAIWISSLSEKKGKKFYFIQHDERVISKRRASMVTDTYKFDMHKITISKWLVDMLYYEFNNKLVDFVPNSVDLSLFWASGRKKNIHPTVGFLYSESVFKGVSVSLSVVTKLAEKIPNLRVVSFSANKQTRPIPKFVELHVNPPQGMIREIYASCDVWLSTSTLEGFGLTLLEAMACGTPCVSTMSGGPQDIITEGENGFLVPVGDEDLLVDRCMKILANFSDAEWESFSFHSKNRANSYTWEDSCRDFERVLLKNYHKEIF